MPPSDSSPGDSPGASPSPSPSPSPSDAAAAVSSPGSSAATSSGPFLGNPGPAFAPEQPDDAGAGDRTPLPEPEPEQLPGELVVWDSERMARALRAQGAITHAIVGAKDAYGRRPAQDWLWQESELAAAAPAFAALANRFPATRAAAAVSDELGAGVALITYATRSLQEGARVRREREQLEPEPAGGIPADQPHADTFAEPRTFADAAGGFDYERADRVRVEPGPIARNGRPARVHADGDQPLPGDIRIDQPSTTEPIE